MKKGRKNLIKRLHADSHPSYKGELEKEFPKLFKEDALVVGKWYKSEIAIFKVTSLAPLKSYGVYSGKWGNEFYTDITTKLRPATDKEVEQALIKEANRRGFNFEVNFKFIEGGVNHSHLRKVAKVGCTFKYEDGRLQTLGYGDWTIYNNGKWATIIETITKEQAEKAKKVLAQYNKQ
jgi:hypothetical protein